MEAVGQIKIPVRSLKDTWNLYGLGDIHWGNAGCHKRMLRENIEKIAADKNGLVIMIGDQIDAIGPGDKRFDATAIDSSVMTIADLANLGEALMMGLQEELKPIRQKIVAAAFGNHEQVYMRRHEQANLHAYFCKDMEAKNLCMSGFLDLIFVDRKRNKETFRVFVHHGAGAAATPGGKINRLVRFMDMVESDITMVGHTHEMLDFTRTKIIANKDCTKLGNVAQLGVVCGGYLLGYRQGVTGYPERLGLHPTSIGTPAVEITPADRTLGVKWLRG